MGYSGYFYWTMLPVYLLLNESLSAKNGRARGSNVGQIDCTRTLPLQYPVKNLIVIIMSGLQNVLQIDSGVYEVISSFLREQYMVME